MLYSKRMIKIAVIEDSQEDSERLLSFLEKYQKEKNVTFMVNHFPDPTGLLDGYRSDYDLIFMDIQMPNINGMEAAKKIRSLDESVLIIFITNLGQCAINGYEVNALDFVVKPIEYDEFKLKLERALCRIHKEDQESVLFPLRGGNLRLAQSDILYIETLKHRSYCHTASETYKLNIPLNQIEKMLDPSMFARCNSCYLVNLKYVSSIEGHDCKIGDTILQISQPRKKEFVSRFIDYMEGK